MNTDSLCIILVDKIQILVNGLIQFNVSNEIMFWWEIKYSYVNYAEDFLLNLTNQMFPIL